MPGDEFDQYKVPAQGDEFAQYKVATGPAGGTSSSWGGPIDVQPSDARTIPNARIRNLPNPAEGETSAAGALYHGMKAGATLASIPASLALSLPQAMGGVIGSTIAGKGSSELAGAFGAGPMTKEIAGDVGGLVGGGVGGSMAESAYGSQAGRMLDSLTRMAGASNPRNAPAWQGNPSFGTEVPSILDRGPAPVSRRTTFPNSNPGAPLPRAANWQINNPQSSSVPSIMDQAGPSELPLDQQVINKISQIGNQPQPNPSRPAPAWQTNPQPIQEIGYQGSTPDEIQAHLQRMAARASKSRPVGAPPDTPESPYQVQNIPVQGAKVPQAQGTPANLPEMQPSQSTTISQHGYDPAKQQMTVQFKNGNIYRYSGVPQKVFDQYSASESQGSFHANNIKGRYQTDLIGKVKPTPGQKVSQALGGQQ